MGTELKEKEESKRFELVMATRDAKGNPTGTKSFATDSAYKLDEFYQRNKFRPKTKKNVAKVAGSPKEIENALAEILTHAVDKLDERLATIEKESESAD